MDVLVSGAEPSLLLPNGVGEKLCREGVCSVPAARTRRRVLEATAAQDGGGRVSFVTFGAGKINCGSAEKLPVLYSAY